MSSVVVLDHRIFWDTITFKIPPKVVANATDYVICLNKNYQEQGDINKYTDITYDQEPKEIFTNTNVIDADNYTDMGLNEYDILKNINAINGTQYYPSALTSRTDRTQDDPTTLTSRTGDSKKSSNVTLYKGHTKKLVGSSIF